MSQDNCGYIEPLSKPVSCAALKKARLAYFEIRGMGCIHCAIRVHNALLSQAGVLMVDVLLDKRQAIVAFNPDDTALDQLAQAVAAIEDAGHHRYRAELIRVMLPSAVGKRGTVGC